jgi:hypothetical protein
MLEAKGLVCRFIPYTSGLILGRSTPQWSESGAGLKHASIIVNTSKKHNSIKIKQVLHHGLRVTSDA